MAEGFGERYLGMDDLGLAHGVGAENHAAAAVDVADDGAEVVFGAAHFDAHDGLEDDDAGLAGGFFDADGAGVLECHFRRVDGVVGAVDECDLDIEHGVAGEHATVEGFPGALHDGIHVFLGHGATDDAVFEDEALAAFERFDLELDDTELAAATALADEAALGPGGAGDGFAVAHLGAADIGGDFVLAEHAVDEDFEVEVAAGG